MTYSDDMIMQTYYKDVGNVYEKNDNNYNIEYCEGNRDRLIEVNLKTVISIAKTYANMGLSMEDLIGAGNTGLCVAFDKFKNNNSTLKQQIVDKIESLEDPVSYDLLKTIFYEHYTYGKIIDRFNRSFKTGKTYTKSEILRWIDKNVLPPKFNSVATMWIRAYITNALNTQSRLVRKSISDIKKEKEEGRDVYLDIDKPIGENGSTLADVMDMGNDEVQSMDVEEVHNEFRRVVNLLFDGVKARERRIICYRFGLGIPRPLKPNEIADREHISIARVSQIIQTTIDKMKNNYNTKYHDQIDPQDLYALINDCGNYI